MATKSFFSDRTLFLRFLPNQVVLEPGKVLERQDEPAVIQTAAVIHELVVVCGEHVDVNL